MNSPDYHEKVQIGGNRIKNTMSNITNYAKKAPNLPFTEYDFTNCTARPSSSLNWAGSNGCYRSMNWQLALVW